MLWAKSNSIHKWPILTASVSCYLCALNGSWYEFIHDKRREKISEVSNNHNNYFYKKTMLKSDFESLVKRSLCFRYLSNTVSRLLGTQWICFTTVECKSHKMALQTNDYRRRRTNIDSIEHKVSSDPFQTRVLAKRKGFSFIWSCIL